MKVTLSSSLASFYFRLNEVNFMFYSTYAVSFIKIINFSIFFSQEPFIDIAVGGQELPNGDPDELFVWTVTVLGRVYVRQGVTANCPEGTGWLHIPTPERYKNYF